MSDECVTTTGRVLDACCGSRMFWFDRDDPRMIGVDNRCATYPVDVGTPGTIGRSPIVVRPDVRASFVALPFRDEAFDIVIFDPPHIIRSSPRGTLTRRYGVLPSDWRSLLRDGFAECFRVLRLGGAPVFKWSSVEIPLRDVLELTDRRPIIGHRSGRKMNTHWVLFRGKADRREP